MEKQQARIIRPAKKLTEQEQQELMNWLDEMQAWAKSVGLTEQDVDDSIKAVRQRKRQSQRQSA
ncbi:MAG: hypothetical protein IJQ85_03035 [Selenomonadaceae bacterium]|nr:hypothetical protein [Selenomonadaceae bacterium]